LALWSISAEFQTTEELQDLPELPGQSRAIEAVRFGIGIKRQGYNLFALGSPGTSKHAMIREFLTRAASEGICSRQVSGDKHLARSVVDSSQASPGAI
jgi:hypothetical protein